MMPSTRDETLAILRDRAEALLRDLPDGGRAWGRAERVYGLGRRLARQEEADRFIVGVAALLHALPAPEIAAELALAGVQPQATTAILDAVAGLSRDDLRGESLEARVLWDAHRLDRLGALGIANVLLEGGERGEELHERRDPFALARTLAPDRYLVEQIYTYLAALPRMMHTPTARQVAIRRVGIMLFYLEALRDELAETLPDALLPEADWLVPKEE
jgi:uncharacterized protein